MKIVVIGANGGIGKKTVELALEEGHHVTAILRTPSKLTLSHPHLNIIQGDIMIPGSIEKFLSKADAVVSAIGGKMNQPTTLYSQGNVNLLNSMKNIGVDRAFFISASALEISPLNPWYVRIAAKYIVQKLFKYGYSDQRIMEGIIKEHDIQWTIIRPPRLTNKAATGQYRYAINRFLKNCLNISRADVAHFMLNNIYNTETYKSIVEIAY